MLSQLPGMPLMFFLALLPVLLVVAWGIRLAPIRMERPLTICALTVFVSAVLAQLAFAILYLGSPSFTDHIEPTTAIVAWIYAQGGQIYHGLDAPERFAFLYGPVPYIATGAVYNLLGASTLSAKLAGFICLLVTTFALGAAVRRVVPNRLFPVVVALGYVSLIALFFKNHSFWSKPDPFMMASVAVGLYACTLNPGRTAWMLVAVALGVSVNAKVTGAVYFLPLLTWLLVRDGWRSIFLVAVVSTAVALLPFLFPSQTSLVNYVAWLQSAGGHGLDKQLLIQNSFYLLFMCLPVGLFVVWQQLVAGGRNLIMSHRLVTLTAATAALLILVAGAKPGSGPHHYLPFLPCLGFLAAYGVSQVYAHGNSDRWTVYGYWVPACAFLIAAGMKAGLAVYYGVNVVRSQTRYTPVATDIAAVMSDYPDRHIYMGYGDGSVYPLTFMRHELAYAGQPYLLDPAALMDFKASGLEIPDATIAKMLADRSSVWLIPAGQEPFTLVSWYDRFSGGLVFDEHFRTAFKSNFYKASSTPYFDLYMQTPVSDQP